MLTACTRRLDGEENLFDVCVGDGKRLDAEATALTLEALVTLHVLMLATRNCVLHGRGTD